MHENRIARAIARTITTMQLISVAKYSIYSNFIKENFVKYTDWSILILINNVALVWFN